MINSLHRPTAARVNLEHILFNLHQVMSHLPADTQAWPVVKANAYGHGAVAVAEKLAPHAAGFCLSNLDEALELRKAGIKTPLLVLGVVPPEAVVRAVEQTVQLTVSSRDWLTAVKNFQPDLSGFQFHIKVDSGMGRLGFRDSQDINQTVADLLDHGAEFAGIFTHFATADEADSCYFQEQLAFFQTVLDQLPVQPKIVHASNSAASIWYPDSVFSAVRLGDIIYGLNPSGRTLDVPYPIKPALTLTSELVQVKQVPAHTKIGYGASYESSASEWIGTLPIGYADGLTRDMQGFRLLANGQFCEIVGRVSMDQITVRLPKYYPIGTTVTLIGQEGSAAISVQDWAEYRKTINYEIVCLLSDRIPRIYK